MCKRVSETLHFLNFEVSLESDIIKRAVDAYMDVYTNSLQISQSLHDLLRTLTTKHKLGLVTNFAYSTGAHKVLDQFDLKTFFKAIVISGEVGWKKPSQHIFEVALFQLSVEPEEVIFVGDDYEADILGPKKLGMKTIFLSREPNDNEKADAIIESLVELPSAIRRLSK